MTLCLLHAFPLNSGMWRAQQQELASRCSVITPDFPGFGAEPLVEGMEWTIPAMAQWVKRELDRKGVKRAVIGGLSMGGYVAFECWRLLPERIAGLILADTMAPSDTPVTRRGRFVAIGQLRNGGYQKFAAGMIPKMISETTKEQRPEVVKAVVRMYEEAAPQSVIAALGGLAHRNDSRPLLPTITVPTAVIVGEHDTITTVDDARLMAAMIPNAQLTIIPTAGHLANLEMRIEFNAALLHFLERVGE